jgi:hypothetical protein
LKIEVPSAPMNQTVPFAPTAMSLAVKEAVDHLVEVGAGCLAWTQLADEVAPVVSVVFPSGHGSSPVAPTVGT